MLPGGCVRRGSTPVRRQSYEQAKKASKEKKKLKTGQEKTFIQESLDMNKEEEEEAAAAAAAAAEKVGQGQRSSFSVKFGSNSNPALHRVLSTSALRIPRQRRSFWAR